jgi:acyl-CoA reductase-like NAD-dependent aldehyde dehydrogenase
MHKFAAALAARADGTSKLVSQENGMPIGLSSAFNGAAPAGLLQMYAELAKTMALEEVRPSASGATIVRREPVGVVGAIAPWNYPQVLAMMKIAPALAAGCTIVLKPSPETVLDSYVMGDAARGRRGGGSAGRLDPRADHRQPAGPSVTMGPMASETHLQRVLGYIDIGRNSNARLVSGGGRPADQDRGWFVEPTVFADVDNDDQLAREEGFGPVMAVIPFGDDEDAVRIANDSNYGLGGSVWSTDEQRGLDVARQVRTGTIGVNYYSLDLGAPFGGMKDSGIGRELGPEAINPYLEYKSIYASADQIKG